MTSYPYKEAFIEAKAHARREYPKESVGLIVNGSYIACENVAQPVESHEEGNADCACQLCSFVLDPQVFARHMIEGGVDGVVHSHPNGPFYPSKADMEGQLASGVPWAIIALDAERVGDPIAWGDGLPIAPLIGREFMHGVADCMSLIRDAYRLGKDKLAEQGIPDWPYPPIDFPEFAREDSWWDAGKDYYAENWPKRGFVPIPVNEARAGDVFLMRIRSDKLNHGGVLVSQDLIAHHLPTRLSRREPAGIWGRQAEIWLRYKGPIDA